MLMKIIRFMLITIRRVVLGIVYTIIGLIATYTILGTILLIPEGFKSGRHRCVHLENRLNLGYHATINFTNATTFYSYAVPKFPDGTPLVEDPVWPLFITDTTIHGNTFTGSRNQDFSFAWRADTGLVRYGEDPETYERLIAEAGEANAEIGSGWLGGTIVLRRMMKLDKYKNQWCKTKPITW